MPRIAIAGFQHETNTFAPYPAKLTDFEIADSWPGLLMGEKVISQTQGMNLPIAGAAKAALKAGFEIEPILWCAAEPSGKVTDHAFDHISNMILNGLRNIGPIDALYLDLHGAMVTQSHQDGEGALLRRIRAYVGPDVPIGVSLDLHANITRNLVDLASVITVYRTYPHLDMHQTGARCIERLAQILDGAKCVPAFRQVTFLIPLHAQYTGHAPCDRLYSDVIAADSDTSFSELALGFTAADIHDCGPSVLTYAPTPELAKAELNRLWSSVCAARDEFDTALLSPAKAVEQAMQSEASPVILADVQDNPGAGASSDTTGILREMIAQSATEALVGVICDPACARAAHHAGVGATIDVPLGGKSGVADDSPVAGPFTVEALSDGNFTYTGAMYGGGVAVVGQSCVLHITQNGSDIRVVISSERTQCLDLAFFTAFGLDPTNAHMIAVKSTVHYRADFDPIAARTLNVGAPGLFTCDLTIIPYQNLRPEVSTKTTR